MNNKILNNIYAYQTNKVLHKAYNSIVFSDAGFSENDINHRIRSFIKTPIIVTISMNICNNIKRYLFNKTDEIRTYKYLNKLKSAIRGYYE